MDSKECSTCNEEKDVSEFYAYGKRVFKACKDCMKRPKKILGFAKLPEETRQAVIADFQKGRKRKEIAEEHNINLSTLVSWLRSGQISVRTD